MTKKHKWSSPFEWLMDRAGDWTPHEVWAAMRDLAEQAGDDTIQDIFQDDMKADDYFEPIDEDEKEKTCNEQT